MEVTHRLIIRHPGRAAVLVETDGPRLPVVVTDDRHSAEVDHVNAAVLERFGLVTTVLRILRHDPDPVVCTHELELHDSEPRLPAGCRWAGPDVVASLPADEACIVREGLAGAAAQPGTDASPWTRRGWYDDACDWIAQQIGAGGGSVREIVQLRSWTSCVLRVGTTHGDRYFKALSASGPEWAVTAYLARHFPNAVPRLCAAEAERRWLLMEAAEGRCLEDLPDGAAWQHAAATYGRLQAGCLTHIDDLRALGCPLRGLEQLAAAIAPLAADDAALRTGAAGGLSTADAERFRALVADLRERCGRLAAHDIPLSLEHGDLWPGNLFVAGSASVLIDWEDVAVGHPFFSLAPLQVGLAEYQPTLNTPAVRRALQDAYLAAFADFGDPDRLRAALAMAAPLGFIDMALRYRNQPPSMVRLHPWMRDLVPLTVKLALDATVP